MAKRGISPVIATVLLVSLVIVVGLVVFLWMNDFVPNSVLKSGANIEYSCDNVDFRVELDRSARNLSIINKGNVPIYDLDLRISTEDLSTRTEQASKISDEWPGLGLKRGQPFTGHVPTLFRDGVTEVEVVPVLLGESENPEDGGTEKKLHDCNGRGIKLSIS